MSDARLIAGLRRHALVWIHPGAELRVEQVAGASAEGAKTAMAHWLPAQWPLVVTRQSRAAFPDAISLGMPLPPAAGKRRIALRVDSGSIAKCAPPPALDDVIARLPEERCSALRRLSAAASALALDLAVYGSCAWQAITAMSYLSADSDIDLLFRPSNDGELERGVALLASWEGEGWRADGEILLLDENGDEVGVAWREWVNAKRERARQVLVKSLWDVRLSDVDRLRSGRLNGSGQRPSPR